MVKRPPLVEVVIFVPTADFDVVDRSTPSQGRRQTGAVPAHAFQTLGDEIVVGQRDVLTVGITAELRIGGVVVEALCRRGRHAADAVAFLVLVVRNQRQAQHRREQELGVEVHQLVGATIGPAFDIERVFLWIAGGGFVQGENIGAVQQILRHVVVVTLVVTIGQCQRVPHAQHLLELGLDVIALHIGLVQIGLHRAATRGGNVGGWTAGPQLRRIQANEVADQLVAACGTRGLHRPDARRVIREIADGATQCMIRGHRYVAGTLGQRDFTEVFGFDVAVRRTAFAHIRGLQWNTVERDPDLLGRKATDADGRTELVGAERVRHLYVHARQSVEIGLRRPPRNFLFDIVEQQGTGGACHALTHHRRGAKRGIVILVLRQRPSGHRRQQTQHQHDHPVPIGAWFRSFIC